MLFSDAALMTKFYLFVYLRIVCWTLSMFQTVYRQEISGE